MIVYSATHPEPLINAQILALLESQAAETCFALSYDLQEYYLPEQPTLGLLGLVVLTREHDQCAVEVAVLAHTAARLEQLITLIPESMSLRIFASEHSASWFNLSNPLLLDPVIIPKPWGQEIWYTGIEKRGQSKVMQDGASVPLPWLLSLMPQSLVAGQERSLILLKVLDPLADEVYGDLYFEMHEQKQEVYIVTHVNSQAWPDGTGGIRLGFNPTKRAEFINDAEFKAAYLAAVQNYENVRRNIDRLLDEKRTAKNMLANEPLAPQILKEWLAGLAIDLLEQEREKRQAMNDFTAIKPLSVGDVVKVSCLTPHALQHGVRTVEFQTPVYERKILSFAQKVLTQNHWDTQEALKKISLDIPEQKPLKHLLDIDGVLVEQVVEYDDFEVQRICLTPAACYSYVKNTCETKNSYAILMVITGSIALRCDDEDKSDKNKSFEKSNHYLSGQAMLLPASLGKHQWLAGDEGAILLVALPLVDGDRK